MVWTNVVTTYKKRYKKGPLPDLPYTLRPPAKLRAPKK